MEGEIMKKFMLIALLIGSIFLAACAPRAVDNPAAKSIPQGATFKFETYGGFVPIDMLRQEVVVSPTKVVMTVYGQDDAVSSRYERNITPQQYTQTLRIFNQNGFLRMDATYKPAQVTVADVGDARITVQYDNTSKTVTLEPYFLDYYSDGVRSVFEHMQNYANTIYDMSEDEVKAMASAWIVDAPTYKYDGSDLSFLDLQVRESYPTQYVATYTFQSRQAGYGDRSGSMSAQVMTDHEIVVTIEKGKVVSAIIDGKWDELNARTWVSTLMFQPIQCEKTPWEKWYEEGNIRFIKAPTDAELMVAYYGSVHEIEIRNVQTIEGTDVVPAVCGNVQTYYYTAQVDGSDAQTLIGLGWSEFSQ